MQVAITPTTLWRTSIRLSTVFEHYRSRLLKRAEVSAPARSIRYACFGCGARRRRQTSKPSKNRTTNGPMAPSAVTA